VKEEKSTELEVEQILDKDQDGYYLVKWKSKDNDDDNETWEPYSNIQKAHQLIQKFEMNRKLKEAQLNEKTVEHGEPCNITTPSKRNVIFELDCD